MPSAHRRRLGIAAAVLTAVALAGPAEASAEPCAPAPAAKTFLPWLDVADYVSAPEGDLESAGSWDLDGGAAVVTGNEPFLVGGADDAASLRLPAGGSAATAPMCVGLEHPTLRFFAKGPLLGTLKVDAVVEGHALPVGVVVGTGRWAPSLPLPIVLNTLSLLERTDASFRFTPLLGSSWSVDDVYVDPYRTN